ncbi:hypothetical protein BJX61DRAFT_515221 [Aspergillus egyptiacus]|nr:hypothetical protein BJX61DRAFT_515221 [Aspergillus egyptiacus]
MPKVSNSDRQRLGQALRMARNLDRRVILRYLILSLLLCGFDLGGGFWLGLLR